MDGLTHLDDSATLFVTEKDGTTHTTTAGEERRRFDAEFLRPQRTCSTCGGSGWYQWADTPTGPPDWHRCPCGAGQDEPDGSTASASPASEPPDGWNDLPF